MHCDDQDSMMSQLDKYFPLNPGSVDKPDIYLGAKEVDVNRQQHMPGV